MTIPARHQADTSESYSALEMGPVTGRIHNVDVSEFIDEIPDSTADLIFVDPPFNLGKLYGSGSRDRLSDDDYYDWLTGLLDRLVLKLKIGGALYLYHLPIWAMRFGAFLEKRLVFRHWIAVAMKNNFARGNRLYPAHYALLYFTNGEPKLFRRPKINPPQCRFCQNYIRDYGGYRRIIEANGGINLSDFWDDLSPVRHKGKKHRHQNELSGKLFNRVLAISGGPGLTYVDPFAGSGSGVVEAARAGMNFEACEISAECCGIIAERLQLETSSRIS